MDGPDPFSSSRRAGQREARGDGRGARQGPDAMDMEEKDPMAYTAHCDGRTDGVATPPLAANRADGSGPPSGCPLGTSNTMVHGNDGMDGIWRNY